MVQKSALSELCLILSTFIRTNMVTGTVFIDIPEMWQQPGRNLQYQSICQDKLVASKSYLVIVGVITAKTHHENMPL